MGGRYCDGNALFADAAIHQCLRQKQIYLGTPPEKIVVSTKLDDLPQRMIAIHTSISSYKLANCGLLARAIKMVWPSVECRVVRLIATLGGAWKMYRSGDLSFGQALMAANAPMMIQEAMVKGKPDAGILPSGQVAGLIDDLPSVSDLIESIVEEAQQSAGRISNDSAQRE